MKMCDNLRQAPCAGEPACGLRDFVVKCSKPRLDVRAVAVDCSQFLRAVPSHNDDGMDDVVLVQSCICFKKDVSKLPRIWMLLSCEPKETGKTKQHRHKLFGRDFPRTFLTLPPECPGVKEFLPIGARTKPYFLGRTSMIFGADVHDLKGFRKKKL